MALVGINLRGGELAYDLIDQLHDQGIRIVVLTGYADVPLKQGKVAAVLQKPVRERICCSGVYAQYGRVRRFSKAC